MHNYVLASWPTRLMHLGEIYSSWVQEVLTRSSVLLLLDDYQGAGKERPSPVCRDWLGSLCIHIHKGQVTKDSRTMNEGHGAAQCLP